MVARVGEFGKWVKMVIGYKLSVIRCTHSEDLLYNLVTIVNNTVLFT